MKKGIKVLIITLAGCAAVAAALIGAVYFIVFSNRATTPDEISRKAGLRLPEYEIVSSDDNMDRSASAWSHYCYEVEFNEPLSESFLKRVARKKTCVREGNLLILEDGHPDSWSCSICFYPCENRAVLEYMFWDFLF